jgi:hypothetical protein
MVKIPITPEQFADFCEYHRLHKWRWPAVFSCNAKGEVWVPDGYGYTPPDERDDLRERLPLLGWVADAYWSIREECGRIFIDEHGAYYKPDGRNPIQFVRWDSGGVNLRHRPEARAMTGEEAARLYHEWLKGR